MNSTILKNKIEEINEKKEEIPKVQMNAPVVKVQTKVQAKEEPKKEEMKEIQKDIFFEEPVEPSFPEIEDKSEQPDAEILQPVAGVEAEGEETEEESEED
jgi:hypothetical protein